MSYKIIPTESFKAQVRTLQKKYPRIRQDLKELNQRLKQNLKSGKALGKGVYKLRVKSSDISKGKRAAYRVISYVTDELEKVRLLTIYAKPKKATITDNEILSILCKEGLVKQVQVVVHMPIVLFNAGGKLGEIGDIHKIIRSNHPRMNRIATLPALFPCGSPAVANINL